jgi:hypothetical protein
MADGDKQLPQFVTDVLRGVNRLHPLAKKIAAARQLVPEIARAGLDFLQRLKREEANPPDVPSAIATPAPVPPVNPTIPTPPVLRRAKRGEQCPRIQRILRKIFSPYGLPPRGVAVTKMVIASGLNKEKAAGLAPKDEEGLPDPSDEAIARAIKDLREKAAASAANSLILPAHRR